MCRTRDHSDISVIRRSTCDCLRHTNRMLFCDDVLGDVVCGGFAAPIREGYAEKVVIVTSGEKMALYAANNISSAVRNFEDRSYARIFGLILNHRNVEMRLKRYRHLLKKTDSYCW